MKSHGVLFLLNRQAQSYKSYTKGPGHASETGRASPQPRLKGCQQRQSRGVWIGSPISLALKGKTSECHVDLLGPRDQLAQLNAATKWRWRDLLLPTG